jgi:hypothetical protein
MIGIAKIKNKINAGLTIEAQVSANRVSLELPCNIHPYLRNHSFLAIHFSQLWHSGTSWIRS